MCQHRLLSDNKNTKMNLVGFFFFISPTLIFTDKKEDELNSSLTNTCKGSMRVCIVMNLCLSGSDSQ